MPSVYITRMLVVVIVLCSVLAGKAFADVTVPPYDDPSQTLGEFFNVQSSALSMVWSDDAKKFNITIDTCVSMDTIVGIYQFANGTSKNEATIYDITMDLRVHLRHRKYASQAIANAQLAVNDINAFLDNYVCDNVTVSDTNHDELRRLLDQPDGYWTILIIQSFNLGLGSVLGILVAAYGQIALKITLIPLLVFFVNVLNGLWLNRLTNPGTTSAIGAILGSVTTAFIRHEFERLASIAASAACNFGDTSVYEDAASSITSYEDATERFDIEHGIQGLPCSS